MIGLTHIIAIVKLLKRFSIKNKLHNINYNHIIIMINSFAYADNNINDKGQCSSIHNNEMSPHDYVSLWLVADIT